MRSANAVRNGCVEDVFHRYAPGMEEGKGYGKGEAGRGAGSLGGVT